MRCLQVKAIGFQLRKSWVLFCFYWTIERTNYPSSWGSILWVSMWMWRNVVHCKLQIEISIVLETACTNCIIMWKSMCLSSTYPGNTIYLPYIFTFNGKSLTLTTRTCPSSSVNLKSFRLVCNWRHQSLSNPTYQHRSQSWVKQSGDRLFFHMWYVMDMFMFRISDGLSSLESSRIRLLEWSWGLTHL